MAPITFGTNVRISIIRNDGNTLYVGGSGPNNYTRIQDAIDNASDGDTVFVYSGIYYEIIVVDKSITLKGENTENTIIDGLGTDKNPIITITGGNCILERFQVVNTSDEHWTFAGIIVKSNNNLLRNNIMSYHSNGIWVEQSDNNRFFNSSLGVEEWIIYPHYSSYYNGFNTFTFST